MYTVNRLIHTFKPKNYNLILDLDRKGREFSGKVTISGDMQTEGDAIFVHAKYLTIESAMINGVTADYNLGENDELSLSTGGSLSGKQEVVVEFSGKITDSMNGIYPSYYTHKGEKKELIATQFESHYAREAFPCIDEPEAKATFDVTITTEDEITVLSNMPIKGQSADDGRMTTSFDTTPKMSTYLLAWVAGDLQKKTTTTKSGVEVNVWATPAQPADSLDFGLDIATRTIDFFDEYFDTPYPLPKSDHVALPDFSSGAMENWGLITYRETALLANPKTTSLADKHYAATVIAHELSHQWFGNLVTMKWWNDLWLNESFATMMEYVAIDAIEPDWNIWLHNATGEVPSALYRDALDGVQAVQSDVNHPDEIQTLFDPSIVYAKGARLLTMLQSHIGEDAMRKGLVSYFGEHAYANTEADDLWRHLTASSGQDIKSFMDAWITQSGFPVMDVSRNGNEVTLSQRQLFVGPHEESTREWPVPIAASIEAAPKTIEEEASLNIDGDELFYLNKGGAAHFVTNYDQASLGEIFANIQKLPTIDRLYILQERVLLARADIIPMSDLISLLQVYKNETEEAVWDVLAGVIAEIRKFIDPDTPEEKIFKSAVSGLAEGEYSRLGMRKVPGEPESDTKKRSTIVSLMIYGEKPDVIDEALDIYRSTDIEDLDAETRASILANAVRNDAEGTVDSLMKLYTSHHDSGLRDDISVALTSTRNTNLIESLSEKIKDSKFVRPQDFTYWLVRLIRNRYGLDYMWQWTRDNWGWIRDSFREDSHYDMLPRYMASSLKTQTHLDEYQEFFQSLKSDLSLVRNIEIGTTELRGQVELVKKNKDAVLSELRNLDKLN